MNRAEKTAVAGCLMLVGAAMVALAHCQIPCGIYGDSTRFTTMREHVTTIEKSMKQIVELGTGAEPNRNQLVRWVSNKETHADALSDIVTAYFMAQRIKPVAEAKKEAYAKYVKEITLLHQMLVASMKAKQTTDRDHCTTLLTLIDQFETSYAKK